MTQSAPAPTQYDEITSLEDLREVLGEPGQRVLDKDSLQLLPVHRLWLQASPFCILATADAEGRCDASPKGDPAGSLVHVIDDTTIAIAERPGNRRADGYQNILVNPHVGLNFLIPGRGDTLRINGRARLVRDAPWFDDLLVKGHRPQLAIVVEIEQIFFHCAKAFMRSQLWEPETWDPDGIAPKRAAIAAEVERGGRTDAELEAYYDPANYGKNLYG